MFVRVRLYTRDERLVTSVTMPAFQKNPTCLIWGERFFLLDEEKGKYIEGLAYFVAPFETAAGQYTLPGPPVAALPIVDKPTDLAERIEEMRRGSKGLEPPLPPDIMAGGEETFEERASRVLGERDGD